MVAFFILDPPDQTAGHRLIQYIPHNYKVFFCGWQPLPTFLQVFTVPSGPAVLFSPAAAPPYMKYGHDLVRSF